MSNFKKIFIDPKFSKIFILGIISGMPFAILYTTIIAWLNSFEIDFTIVATLALARLPYSLKIFWSPMLDYFKIPILDKMLGKRQSSMFLTSVGISGVLYYMSGITPHEGNFSQIYYLSFLIGFLAATYDISYDALRIELLSPDEQAIGAAHASLAFRIGCIITGAVALAWVDKHGWENMFKILALFFAIGALTCCIIKTKPFIKKDKQDFLQTTIAAFKDLGSRPYAISVLLTIIIYKIGDAMLSCVGMKFYQVKGFSLTEIAFVVKTCGLIAGIVGGYVGAMIISRIGQFRGLIICGIAMMVTNLGYIWLNHPEYDFCGIAQAIASLVNLLRSSLGYMSLDHQGHEIGVFLITNIVENFTGGMGVAALGGYIAALCNVKFAASHFALLSSCATFANNSLTSRAGYLVELMGWDVYFIFTTVISVPALFMLIFLQRKLEYKKN